MNIRLDTPMGKWRYLTDDELIEITALISDSAKTHLD
jgi:23S rRNA pseudouridine2604 synthase